MSYAARRFNFARERVWKLAKEHVIGAGVLFVASVLVLPLAACGADMKHEAWNLFVYGVVGPLALYGLVFAIYWLRAPAIMDAQRATEIRELRASQGLPIDQPQATKPSRKQLLGRMILAAMMAFYAAVLVFGVYAEIQGRREADTITRWAKTIHLPHDGSPQSIIANKIMSRCNGPARGIDLELCRDVHAWLKSPPASYPPAPAPPERQ